MQFSERLKEIRKDCNYTQKDVYTYLKTSPNGYASYEQGRTEPNLDTLKKLADFFKVSIDFLLDREDDFGNIIVQSTPKNANPDLTENEKKLLDGFRNLSKTTQNMILRFVESAEESEKRA